MNDAIGIQNSLERIGALLRSEMRDALASYGLQPVQFEVLHYVARCNRYSDTPRAVTEYLGQTKGSVSQTLKVLEKKGLLGKTPDSEDGRVVHLHLTAAGRRLLAAVFPSATLASALPDLTVKQSTALANGLVELLRTMQQRNALRSFGQCFSCVHHLKLGRNRFQCGLTGEALTRADTTLICREHADAA